MVISIYFLLLFVFTLLSHRKFGRWINIVSIFTTLWCLFGSISVIGLYDILIPSVDVHKYAWMFVICVNIPFLVGVKKQKVTNAIKNKIEDNFTITGGTLPIVNFFTVILLIPLLFKMVSTLLNYGSLTTIRQFFFSGNVFSSVYLDLLFRQMPFGMLEGLIVCYVYYAIKKKHYSYFVYAIVDALLATLVSGGRYPAMLLIYSMVIVLLMEGKNFHIKERFTKKIKLYISLGIIFLLSITIIRGQEIGRSIIVYFSGSFSFLERIISDPNTFALNDRTYGYLMFGAILEPIVLLLKVLGITDVKVPQWHFNTYCQPFYNIGTSSSPIYYNNNTSIIYYLLRDFGVFGIILGGLLLGTLLSKLHNQASTGKDFSSLVYIYMCNVLFNTVMTYQFFGTVPLFVIFAMVLCSNKKNIRIKFR